MLDLLLVLAIALSMLHLPSYLDAFIKSCFVTSYSQVLNANTQFIMSYACLNHVASIRPRPHPKAEARTVSRPCILFVVLGELRQIFIFKMCFVKIFGYQQVVVKKGKLKEKPKRARKLF